MNSFHILTRRSFLQHSAKLGLGIALSTLTDIPLVMKRALAAGGIGTNGKKILFIWLRGANDGLNSLAPVQDPAYYSSRSTLAVPAQSGLDYGAAGIPAFDATQFSLDDSNPDNRVPRVSTDATYDIYPKAIRLGNGFAALHPSLKFLTPIYNAGDLALVHRVGYPNQSRSHFDSQRYWENGTPNNNITPDGMFYRAIWESGLANTSALTGVSIQSTLPLILRGSKAAMANLSDPTRYDLLGIPEGSTHLGDAKATNALFIANGYPFPDKLNRDLLQLQYGNLTKTLGIFGSLNFTDAGNIFQDDVKTDGDTAWVPINGSGTSIGDPTKGYFLFPATADKNGGWRRPDKSTRSDKYVVDPGQQSFFNNLKAAALVLNKTDAIIAGTELGGFDTHNNQGTLTGSHPVLNRTIGWAMYALRKYFFNYADKATWENVVVVTLSEFGRTTVENSTKGTDHAEASLMFVAGGAIQGYGKAGITSGVFNCGGATDPIPWATGTSGAMFGVQGRYLKRVADYRSVLGELIRKHLGATDTQIRNIIPGYVTEPELGGQRVVTNSTKDKTPILGEVGLL